MNMLLKSAVAGALALGASSAFALGVPSSNSSDLVLLIENSTSHAAYAYDTGISINSVLPTGSLVANASVNTSLAGVPNTTVAPTATLSSFLAANPVAGDGFEIEAGQYNASNSNSVLKVPGGAKMIISSFIGTSNNLNVTGKVVANLQLFLGGYNQDVLAGGGLASLTGTETGTANSSIPGENKYGFYPGNDNGTLGGTALQIFGFTGNGTTGVLQSYILGTASVGSDGTLTLTGNSQSAVPLPPAVWLLGSGLLGLVGVSRRRKSVAA